MGVKLLLWVKTKNENRGDPKGGRDKKVLTLSEKFNSISQKERQEIQSSESKRARFYLRRRLNSEGAQAETTAPRLLKKVGDSKK